jgi:hypothetical protein
MTLPYANETISDGALGAQADDPSNVVALVGACSLGTPGQLYSFTQPQALRAALGFGPLVELAAYILVRSKGKVTLLCVPATTTASSLTAGAHTGAGLATIADNSSAPLDDIDLVVKVIATGSATTALLQISLDGGRTFGSTITASATLAIAGTGISLTLDSGGGNFLAGDTYAFEAKAPTYDVAAQNAALTALLNDARRWKLVHCVGIPASAAAGYASAQALDAKLIAAEGTSRYARGFCDGPEAADSAAKGAYSQVLERVGVAGGFVPLRSALSGLMVKRPAMWAAIARAAIMPIHEDLGRVASGPLPDTGRLASTTDDPIAWSYHDETFATVTLDDAGFITLRTIIGRPGVYCTQGTMMTSPTSDFRLLQNGLVMDAAATAGHDLMVEYLNDSVRVDKKTGFIDERDAQAIEQRCRAAIAAKIINEGHATDVQVIVQRDINLLSTKKLKYRVRVIPFGYFKYIDGEYGFSNPALVAA